MSIRSKTSTTSGSDGFKAVKNKKGIDRALPMLVVALSLMEAFGYTRLELTERELGAGLDHRGWADRHSSQTS